MPRVCVAMTTGGMIHTDTVSCLIDLIVRSGIESFVVLMNGGYKPFSMLGIVESARKNKATHILSIDNDMIFPPDGLQKLLDDDKDIVGAPYNERHMPLISTVKLKDAQGNYIVGDISQYRDLFKCNGLGLGFVLMKTDIFDKVEKPWFNAPVDEKDNFSTEDSYFFNKAQEKGIEIYCDPRVIVKHLGIYMY